eukprot:CAMPEP_0178478278 /NCGR_PEP_ID=MMETSP0696-20121128/4577_1 /TAXON_ID=265572 /ORGANISM="Extubocellulus spinifer, Strain CCMP396" /LENGTH=353 /DNA_ID=CAMNT_0020105641 /DNA_START=133 /DNA_END=1193 /DNA_ORIENTATION=+
MLARSSTVIHRTIITAATAPLHSSQRKKVVVTALAFQDTYDTLTSAGLDVTRNESTEPWSLDELISQAHDAHAILAFMTDCCDKTLLDACPNLEMIACALKGFDNFDTELCAERGIAVTAVPDLLTAPTAELGLLLALGLGRRIREADEAVKVGFISRLETNLYGTGLAGANIGIFGAGAVGQAVAERIQGFGPARISYVDPMPLDAATAGILSMDAVECLDELIQQCDVLFICAPLNASTRHSVNDESLAKAKPGIQLINISRGSCVDESAVADALESGSIGGYAADVFGFEDWILEERPDRIDARLLSHPRTLFSPHLGSAVTSTRRSIERAAADEIVRWKNDEPYKFRVN